MADVNDVHVGGGAYVVIRVDASLQMGIGHVMRCLTLAEALRSKGCHVRFASRELPGHQAELITAQGFLMTLLPAPGGDALTVGTNDIRHADWLGVDWRRDAEETAAALDRRSTDVDWLVVDHYALDHRWEASLRGLTRRLMVIDDMADRAHDCDLLLDQNLYRNTETRYRGKVPGGCSLLLGPGFALLRDAFLKQRQNGVSDLERPFRLLIFLGGTDATNVTGKALEAIIPLLGDTLCCDVVVGRSNPHRQNIQAQCEHIPTVSYHCQPDQLPEIMAQATVSIGAGGSTTWERCCLGLPSLMVSTSFNQEAIAQGCDQHGIGIYLGRADRLSVDRIRRAVEDCLRDGDRLRVMAGKAMKLVDGHGASRVVSQMMGFPVEGSPL